MAITLLSQGGQEYISEDGRVRVVLDTTFETECDHEHPVKIRLDKLRSQYGDGERGQEAYEKFIRGYGKRIISRYLKSEGRTVEYLTYLCEGGDYHYYSMWTSQIDDEWTDVVTDDLKTTIGGLESLLGDTIKISPRRTPSKPTRETVYHPVTGAATWAACGHRAELDINDQCYTCHGDV